MRLRESLYLLIPVDIARLVGVASASKFSLTIDQNDGSVKLVYELKKENSDQQVPQTPVEL